MTEKEGRALIEQQIAAAEARKADRIEAEWYATTTPEYRGGVPREVRHQVREVVDTVRRVTG